MSIKSLGKIPKNVILKLGDTLGAPVGVRIFLLAERFFAPSAKPLRVQNDKVKP
jgi:hypothetical protein